MKNLLYILAVIAIGAGAVFSWQVKDKTNAQLDSLSELKGLTSNLSKSIDREEGNKSDADTAKNESRSAKDEVVAGLEAAEGVGAFGLPRAGRGEPVVARQVRLTIHSAGRRE